MAARATTAGELTKLRRNNQSARLYVAFLAPATIYSAQVNQSFATTDEITQVTYDNGSGTLASVKIGMTMLIGSSAGAYDVGWCRVRAAPDATTFYISEESEIDWDNDLYLTVVQDFQLVRKDIKLDASGVAFMDVNVAYSNQHASPNPVPVLGPHVRVLKLAPTTASVAFDGSSSYVIGGTIASYLWACTTASGSSGTGTATPTFTFNSVGWHLVECTVTAATTGTTKTGYRWVYVYDDANKPAEAQLEECAGDSESGGWSFTVTLYDQADLTLVRDRALCVSFAEDVYGTEAGSLGPVTGAESTICWGWVAGETIVLPPSGRGGEVTFEAQGPQAWLARIPAFPAGLEDVQAAPTVWTEFEDLTVRKGAWHLLEWRTTATTIIDVNLTSDTRGLPSFEGGRSYLWDQLVQNCSSTILASPRVDRYGSLYVDVDANYTPEASRSSFPNVMDLTRPDWKDKIQGERVTVPRVGQNNQSGIVFTDGEATSLFSLAPGHVPKKYGAWDVRDRLLLSTQALANELAGLIIARENNQFPLLIINLAANNRFFDIAPAQYIRLTVAVSDTERGFSFTNKRFIPRRVRFVHDRDSMMLTCDLEVEAEVVADLAVTGDAPSTPPELPLPPIPPLPPIITFPGPPAEASEVWFLTASNINGAPLKLVYSGDFFKGGQPTWNAVDPPSGLASLVNTQSSFDLLFDGSVAYFYGVQTGTNRHTIWKATTPRVASPTWTKILEQGVDSPNGSPFTVVGRPFVFGTKLVCMSAVGLTQYYSEYNGNAWTHNQITTTFTDLRSITPYRLAYAYNDGATTTVKDSPDNTTLATFSSVLQAGVSGWQNMLGGSRFMFKRTSGPTVNYVHNINGASDPLSGFNLPTSMWQTEVGMPCLRGAHKGTQVMFVDSDGAAGIIYKSADGVTWVSGATWLPGLAETALLVGGNTMVWMPSTVPNSNEMCRISTDGFATAGTNMTGNFWTDIQTSGDFYMLNMRCIFKRNTESGQ